MSKRMPRTPDCWETDLKGPKTAKYPIRMCLNKHCSLHLASFFVQNGHLPKYTASHRCNNARCFNPDHLRDEPGFTVNISRRCCHVYFKKPGYEKYVCPHGLHNKEDECIPWTCQEVDGDESEGEEE